MIRLWTSLLLAALCAAPSLQRSTPESKSYVAAVVEFSPTRHDDGPATLKENARRYLQYILEATGKNADIIVFPEDGITTINMPANKTELCQWTTAVPAPKENYVPCIHDSVPGISESLKMISCAAREHRIYVQVNHAEKFCETDKCPEKCIFYNTNVVFDREGRVIARYRKTHLFGELQFNVTEKPELCIYKTDFNVTFGCFICFDILFKEALILPRAYGIQDITYSTAWFSEIPFLTAIQTQSGWSYANDVNFLAAGYNKPEVGSTGSGIYKGRDGPAAQVFKYERGDQLLVATVPKKSRGSKQESASNEALPADDDRCPAKQSKNPGAPDDHGILRLLHDKTESYTSVAISDRPFEQELCHAGFCCSFKVETTNFDPASKYRAVVFNGYRFYGKYVEAAVQTCGVIQCVNDSVASCGSVRRSNTVFTKLEVMGTFQDYKDILVFPSVLNSSLLPLQDFSYDEHGHNDHVHLNLGLNCPTDNIATFALYARIFSEDPTSAAPPMTVGAMLIPLLLAVLYSGSRSFYVA